MKLNWGHYITITLGLFMLFIAYLVFQASKQRVDLVADDYYEQEINYQSRINAIDSGKEFENEFIFSREENVIKVLFPDSFKNEELTGEFHFYRPDNSSLDKKIAMQPNENNMQLIERNQFNNGFYEVHISWEVKNEQYFFKKKITIGE